MKLFVSGPSPYVRKVLVCAHERGVTFTLENVQQTPLAPSAAVAAQNPLGKIPTLVLEDGTTLFDSAVICEYVDTIGSGTSLIPARERFRVLRLHALADGLIDAAVAIRYERAMRPPELQYDKWVEAQALKVTRALTVLTQEHAHWGFDLGTITVACALGWMDFRSIVPNLRADYPALYAWYDEMCARPSFAATTPRE